MFPASQPSLSRSHRGWRQTQPGLERGPQRFERIRAHLGRHQPRASLIPLQVQPTQRRARPFRPQRIHHVEPPHSNHADCPAGSADDARHHRQADRHCNAVEADGPATPGRCHPQAEQLLHQRPNTVPEGPLRSGPSRPARPGLHRSDRKRLLASDGFPASFTTAPGSVGRSPPDRLTFDSSTRCSDRHRESAPQPDHCGALRTNPAQAGDD